MDKEAHAAEVVFFCLYLAYSQIVTHLFLYGAYMNLIVINWLLLLIRWSVLLLRLSPMECRGDWYDICSLFCQLFFLEIQIA